MSRAAKSALVLLAAGLAWLAVTSAPAPLPRAGRARVPFGPPCSCRLVWHGGSYRASFDAGGGYHAGAGPDAVGWVGRWRREGGRVVVQEHPAGYAPGQYTCSWSFRPGERGAIHVEPWGE